MRRWGKRRLFKKPLLTRDQYEEVQTESGAAKELLEDERFLFFRDYLENTKHSIEEMILENRITELRESVKISARLKRTFVTRKKVQIDELVGQYKLVKQILSDLATTSKMKDELDEALEKKEVVLEDEEV